MRILLVGGTGGRAHDNAGGTQIFHRVALERVGRAVAAAVPRAPTGRWACNVGDPSDLTPWNVRHPVIADTDRLRRVLGAVEPDPLAATTEQIAWLWDRRADLEDGAC